MVPIELSNRKEYDRASSNIISYLEGIDPAKASAAERAEALTRIEVLKQLAVDGKIDGCVDWIRDYLESGKKLVVFATHARVIDRLVKEFGKIAVKIDGSVHPSKRQVAVDRFQQDEQIRLFIGNIDAAGVGITLTAADSTCFLEFGWTPGGMSQAEDRVHRIGQTSDVVNAYYMAAAATVDEQIISLLEDKQRVLDAVLDGKEAAGSTSIWGALIKSLVRGKRVEKIAA
jgi:SWI/SNF-related matrix-associated actin-dependent regulator 1 of chromatin subfamily A